MSMQYRKLGKTGLEVSEIGFGAEWMDKPDSEVLVFVEKCQGSGINIMDIWMSNPEIRRKLGDALAALDSRDKWVIQGHIGATWQNDQYVRTRDVDACREAFEDLLVRLQTDHVEVGMIHYVDSPDEFTNIMDESPYLEYVRALRRSNTIEHIGLSTHNPHVAHMALEHPEIEVIMLSINPAFDMKPASDERKSWFDGYDTLSSDGIDPLRAQFYRMAEDQGVGITVMKPYAGGRLLDAEKSPFGVAMSAAQCIAYCLSRPAVAAVMAGYSELSHIDDALAYETACDSEKDYASVLAHAPVHAYRGHCIYCGHCQPCAVGIDIATVNKFSDLAASHEVIPESVRAHYFALNKNASDCIGCGACEPNCPFGVKIAERMTATAALFGD